MNNVFAAASVFAPLAASSGTVVIMARVYQLHFSRFMAAWVICVWSTCQMACGVAFLRHVTTSEWITVLFIVIAWMLTSVAFVWRHFLVGSALSFANFIAHYVLIGLSNNVITSVFAVVSSCWVCWAMVFAGSFSIYVRRRHKVPQAIGGRVVRSFRGPSQQNV